MKLTLVSLFAVSALQGVNSLPLFGFNFSFFPFFSPPSSSRPSPSKCFSCRGQRTSSIFISKDSRQSKTQIFISIQILPLSLACLPLNRHRVPLLPRV